MSGSHPWGQALLNSVELLGDRRSCVQRSETRTKCRRTRLKSSLQTLKTPKSSIKLDLFKNGARMRPVGNNISTNSGYRDQRLRLVPVSPHWFPCWLSSRSLKTHSSLLFIRPGSENLQPHILGRFHERQREQKTGHVSAHV